MTIAINDYVLNEVNEPADWSLTEYTLLSAIVGKLPNRGSIMTPAARHAHSVLISPDEQTNPVLSCDNNGDVTFNDDVFLADNGTIFFGTVAGNYGSVKYSTALTQLYLYSNQSIGLKADGTEIILTAPSVVLNSSTAQNILFKISSTTYFGVGATGIIPQNNATIHCAAQNDAPTSTTNGALWLDTDGGSSGILYCYSSGGWQTVATW